MDTLSWCMFLKLRICFVQIVDLIGLAYPTTNQVGHSNYVITYTDNQMELYITITLIKCAVKQTMLGFMQIPQVQKKSL